MPKGMVSPSPCQTRRHWLSDLPLVGLGAGHADAQAERSLEILDAAVDTFAAKGYAQTDVQEIADRADEAGKVTALSAAAAVSGARRVTAARHTGSLPRYLGLIIGNTQIGMSLRGSSPSDSVASSASAAQTLMYSFSNTSSTSPPK